MTQQIGFTGVYYTLWHITQPYRKYRNQFEYDIVQDFTYIQNLSRDLNQAKAKLKGDFTIDLSLKGEEGWCFSRVIASEINTLEQWQFSFGKLAGEDIRVTSDVWQLKRAVEQERGFRRRVIARRRLAELGVMIRHNRKWIAAEELEKIKKREAEANETYGHHYKNGEQVKIKVKIISHKDLKNRFGYFAIVEYIDMEFRRYKYIGSSPCVYKQEKDGKGITVYNKITEWHEITADIEHVYNNGRLETKLKKVKLIGIEKYELKGWEMLKII